MNRTPHIRPGMFRKCLLAALLATSLMNAEAHADASADLSALSALPVAISVGVPAIILSGGVALTVVAVEASAEGTVWVLERASDGARASMRLTASASVAIGTGVVVTAISAGWVLSAAGQAIAFIPNEIGAALLYNERVTR